MCCVDRLRSPVLSSPSTPGMAYNGCRPIADLEILCESGQKLARFHKEWPRFLKGLLAQTLILNTIVLEVDTVANEDNPTYRAIHERTNRCTNNIIQNWIFVEDIVCTKREGSPLIKAVTNLRVEDRP